MTFHIVTLFPGAFDSYLGESIIKRAIEKKLIKVAFYNPRDFVKPTKTQKNKAKPYLRIDDRPYGGGPGMVMQAMPIVKAIEKAIRNATPKKTKLIWLSPGGTQFTNETASAFSKKYTDVVIVCGRYEGIDARVKKIFKMDDISVGPFVLTGGELPAMIIMDAAARQIEGVLGDFSSREETRNASPDIYTRPEILVYKKKAYKVPKVLLSGNHKKIDGWRLTRKGKGV